MAAQRSETKKEKIEIWVRSRKSPLFTLQFYKNDFVQLFTLFQISTFINVNYYNMKKVAFEFRTTFCIWMGFPNWCCGGWRPCWSSTFIWGMVAMFWCGCGYMPACCPFPTGMLTTAVPAFPCLLCGIPCCCCGLGPDW